MPLADSLANYRNSIVEANSFIASAYRRDGAGVFVLPANERAFITDSAFLKMFIAWESFIEDSFLQYMMGEPSILGNAVNRYCNPIDRNHANGLLIGSAGKKFVDWSTPDTVRLLAQLHFGPGNPYETFVGAVNGEILDLKTIRNAAAHLSSTTQTKLIAVIGRKLGAAAGGVTTVAGLLFTLDPTAVTPGDTILTTYLNVIDVAAEGIANA